jgi:hypothetical protein
LLCYVRRAAGPAIEDLVDVTRAYNTFYLSLSASLNFIWELGINDLFIHRTRAIDGLPTRAVGVVERD